MTEKRSVTCFGGPLDGETFESSGGLISAIENLPGGLYCICTYRTEGNIARVFRRTAIHQTRRERLDRLCDTCHNPSMWETVHYRISELGVSGPLIDKFCGDGCDVLTPK